MSRDAKDAGVQGHDVAMHAIGMVMGRIDRQSVQSSPT